MDNDCIHYCSVLHQRLGWANVYSDPSVSELFEGKALYSIIKNGNALIMIRELSTVWVPCYTESLSKVRRYPRLEIIQGCPRLVMNRSNL